MGDIVHASVVQWLADRAASNLWSWFETVNTIASEHGEKLRCFNYPDIYVFRIASRKYYGF